MRFRNLTQHNINIYDNDGNEVMSIPTEMFEARVPTKVVETSNQGGVSLQETRVTGKPFLNVLKKDETTGKNKVLCTAEFPEQEEGTILIVSGLTRSYLTDRTDVYQPGLAVRDEDGRIIGSKGLSR